MFPEHPVVLEIQSNASMTLRIPHMRTAWIVPVVGRPSHHCATQAELLDDCSPPCQAIDGSNIAWSPAALQQFWNFLLRLQAKNVLGAIGLSFDILEKLEFLKIYHDAKQALRLRCILASFRHEHVSQETDCNAVRANSDTRDKCRPLNGAKLLLVDELNLPLLLS